MRGGVKPEVHLAPIGPAGLRSVQLADFLTQILVAGPCQIPTALENDFVKTLLVDRKTGPNGAHFGRRFAGSARALPLAKKSQRLSSFGAASNPLIKRLQAAWFTGTQQLV